MARREESLELTNSTDKPKRAPRRSSQGFQRSSEISRVFFSPSLVLCYLAMDLGFKFENNNLSLKKPDFKTTGVPAAPRPGSRTFTNSELPEAGPQASASQQRPPQPG